MYLFAQVTCMNEFAEQPMGEKVHEEPGLRNVMLTRLIILRKLIRYT
jgi:hypothetical protein